MKLNQVIAIEKGVKSRLDKEITALHRLSSKDSIFKGFIQVFEKTKEDYPDEPDQKQPVQLVAGDVLKQAAKSWIEILNITSTKDYANQHATANVIFNGEVLIADAPVPFLLSLEKRLSDMKKFVEVIPTLSFSETWKGDGTGIFVSEETKVRRTMKVQEPLVLFPATPEHPAQTQLVTNDIVVGFWKKKHLCGALDAKVKKDILDRIQRLSDAVKIAREEANSVEVEKKNIGTAILEAIFAPDIQVGQ